MGHPLIQNRLKHFTDWKVLLKFLLKVISTAANFMQEKVYNSSVIRNRWPDGYYLGLNTNAKVFLHKTYKHF